MSQRLEPYIDKPHRRLELLTVVYHEAKRANLPPELILAVIHTESGFDQFAVSTAGAQGLMQVMPFWKYILGDGSDNLMHLPTNIKFGVAILANYLEREQGDLTRALARYNGSVGKTWYPQRVYAKLNRYWLLDI